MPVEIPSFERVFVKNPVLIHWLQPLSFENLTVCVRPAEENFIVPWIGTSAVLDIVHTQQGLMLARKPVKNSENDLDDQTREKLE